MLGGGFWFFGLVPRLRRKPSDSEYLQGYLERNAEWWAAVTQPVFRSSFSLMLAITQRVFHVKCVRQLKLEAYTHHSYMCLFRKASMSSCVYPMLHLRCYSSCPACSFPPMMIYTATLSLCLELCQTINL